jgi:IrrE N-terminal-like domain
MRFYTSRDGIASVWYDDAEIEQIVDEELTRAGIRPTPAAPVTDLERFIESHLSVELDQYAELPDGVLGLTRFTAHANPSIHISAALTQAADAGATAAGRGRWRATLAHEASHVLLHKYLFDPELIQSELPGLSGQLSRTGDFRCLNRDLEPRSRNPREVQANKGMAALLMPRDVFRRAAFRRIDPQAGELTVGSAPAARLAAEMAVVFDVSKQAAAIRLETMGIVNQPGVTALPGLGQL